MEDQRTALVTLASEHASPAVARYLAARGYRLFLQGADAALVDELRGQGATLALTSEDLTTQASASRCIDEALTAFGQIDAAWVRTGLVSREIGAPFLESNEGLWSALKLHNIDMLVYILRALLPPMIAVGHGNVMVSTSAAGLKPLGASTLYGATRAAAIALVRSLGLEFATSGVTINAVATAFLDAPIFKAASGADTPEGLKRVKAKVPMRRLGSPEELAEFAGVFLEGRTRFQTGQCFSFSGGWSP